MTPEEKAHIKRLGSRLGFQTYVLQQAHAKGITREASYYLAEEECFQLFGARRYSSYESFVQVINRDVRNKTRKKKRDTPEKMPDHKKTRRFIL